MPLLKRILPLVTNLLKRPIQTRNLTSIEAIADVKVESEDKDNDKSILVEKRQEITMISINRPEKKNSLDKATLIRLSEALDEFEKDDEACVGILNGVGGNFCAGYDLFEIEKYDGESEENVAQFNPLTYRQILSKKPIIAAISGYAVGVGLELALMCDLRVVEGNAMLGFLNRRFGIPIMCGGTVRLPAMVGYSRAMDLILTGRCISGYDAFNWGLSNQTVTPGAALGQSQTIAKCIAKFPQKTLLADRASMHYATFSAKQFEEALQFEKDNSSYLLFEEGVQGAKLFAEGHGRHGRANHLIQQGMTFKPLSEDML